MNPIWFNAVRASARAALDPDAITLIAAMTTAPDATRQQLISDHIIALKAAGIWSQLDTYYMMAAHHEQASRLNWKSPGNFTLEASGTITFTVDRGWQGDGSTGYLDTGWIPATHGVNYTLNDASLGVYSRTDFRSGDRVSIGAVSSSTSRFSEVLTSGSNLAARVNNGSGSAFVAVIDTLSLMAGRRVDSANVRLLKRGVVIQSAGVASTGLLDVPFFICARNVGDSPSLFSPRQYAAAFAAAAMSEPQHAALYDAMQNGYLAAVGAAV